MTGGVFIGETVAASVGFQVHFSLKTLNFHIYEELIEFSKKLNIQELYHRQD